ncbi:thionin-like protein 2 [Quillaja saponaria]|uniref:Thionin-like protein 2 n=1 Tax=Quillaja saponaria TaxID=32244 RepID=A0AAD7PW90_QUISA|nr:thionin-like protein 2 [Quillaja saponaria]
MEGKTTRSIVIFTLFLVVLTGQSAADSAGCYLGCLRQCNPKGTGYGCSITCAGNCFGPATILDTSHTNNAHFCKLGCVVAKCTKFTTEADPAANKVNICVNACSQSCLKY